MQNKEAVLRDAIRQINEKEALNNELLLTSYKDERKKIHIPFIPEHDNVLVFKVSDRNCDLCVDTVMNILINDKWHNRIDMEVWIEVQGAKSIFYDKFWYKKMDSVAFRTIGNDQVRELYSDNFSKPFFFVYNRSEQTVSHIFFPVLDNSENVKKYLAIISEKYVKERI
jgi:hypothetical protein